MSVGRLEVGLLRALRRALPEGPDVLVLGRTDAPDLDPREVAGELERSAPGGPAGDLLRAELAVLPALPQKLFSGHAGRHTPEQSAALGRLALLLAGGASRLMVCDPLTDSQAESAEPACIADRHFDLVLDLGCAEQTSRPAQVLAFAHSRCAAGGLLAHMSPPEEFPRRLTLLAGFWQGLCAANGYQVEYLLAEVGPPGSRQSGPARLEELPEADMAGLDAARRRGARVAVVLRKPGARPFVRPFWEKNA